MTARILFDFPPGWQLGLPLVVAMLVLAWRSLRGRGLGRGAASAFCGFRAVALLVLVFLAARPVWVAKDEEAKNTPKSVVLLLDRSESMSLEENGETRYAQTMAFTRARLLPALHAAGLNVHPLLFSEDAEVATGNQAASAQPNGRRTNLGGAIARGLATVTGRPLAVIAITDGVANESADNARAFSALADAGVPFIGVGVGNDRGVQTLMLRRAEAPPIAAPNAAFTVTAQIEMMNAEAMPPFDLALLRDGRLQQTKTVNAGKGSRFWQETFRVIEKDAGVHNYTVQLVPPSVPGLKCVETQAATTVRISNEKELRVLYVQGALTWDYKFIGLALRGDPAIKLTGLTRTSSKSVFRQNVESAGELLGGFPTMLEELAPYRVVVISNLRPADLNPAQQELLVRFCGELGGGVLMIGGTDTFDFSWQGSRLEQMLPVVFSPDRGVRGLDRPFHLQVSDEALQHPVFQIRDDRPSRDAWAQLPVFTHYSRVDSAKAGAQVWAVHQEDQGLAGRRILMAAQRYGAGQSAVICVQNFWRWRLAKDCESQYFDRFWRQLFRYLGESGRQDVAIHFASQDLRPRSDVRVVLERQPNPKNIAQAAGKFSVRVESGDKAIIHEQVVELAPARPVELAFRAEKEGLYTVTVLDAMKQAVANRSLEIRDINVELQQTARNMEGLRQWAALSDGLAVKLEDCRDDGGLVNAIRSKIDQVRRNRVLRRPVGVNGWMLALTAGCLGAEWILRKRFGLS